MDKYTLICIANIILSQPKRSKEEQYVFNQKLYKDYIYWEQSKKEFNQYIKENPPSL